MKITRILSLMLIGSMLQTAFISNASETNKTVDHVKKKKKPTKKEASHKKHKTTKETHKKPTKIEAETKREREEHKRREERRKKRETARKQTEARNNGAKRRAVKNPGEKNTAAQPATAEPKRSFWSRMTGSGTATGATAGAVGAGTVAAGAAASSASNRVSHAIHPDDRKKAALDTSWKKNEDSIHKFHEGTYHEIVNTKELRDAKERNNWHWIKLEHGKQGYAFYNPACGWMYKLNTTGEWYQPCKKKFVKQLNFDL